MTNRALVIVDVQVDFCEGGALAVTGGSAVAERITRFLLSSGTTTGRAGLYQFVVTTQDWHVDPAAHFARPGTEPDYALTWPEHCRAGTPGAALHPALQVPAGTLAVFKGEYSPGYSGFEGRTLGAAGPGGTGRRTLRALLDEACITRLDVVGIAEDHCVAATAIDGTKLGFETRVIVDLTVGVAPGSTERARADMRDAGVTLVESAAVLVGADDRVGVGT